MSWCRFLGTQLGRPNLWIDGAGTQLRALQEENTTQDFHRISHALWKCCAAPLACHDYEQISFPYCKHRTQPCSNRASIACLCIFCILCLSNCECSFCAQTLCSNQFLRSCNFVVSTVVLAGLHQPQKYQKLSKTNAKVETRNGCSSQQPVIARKEKKDLPIETRWAKPHFIYSDGAKAGWCNFPACKILDQLVLLQLFSL